MGLCEALARNYLNNVGKGKKIEEPVIFQGGVAANVGLKTAFEKLLQVPISVPEHHDVMGAIGAALLAREHIMQTGARSSFKGDDFIMQGEFQSISQECKGCSNYCEVVCIKRDNEALAYWGDRCKKWETSLSSKRGLKVV